MTFSVGYSLPIAKYFNHLFGKDYDNEILASFKSVASDDNYIYKDKLEKGIKSNRWSLLGKSNASSLAAFMIGKYGFKDSMNDEEFSYMIAK